MKASSSERGAIKILILRFSSIGDILLTTPVIRCLRKAYPDAIIHFATKEAFAPVLQHNPYINKIHYLSGSALSLVSELREERFDLVIDLHHNQRTLLIKLLLGVKSRSFSKLNFRKWLLTAFKINRLPHLHIVDRYIKTCEDLGLENDGEGLDYFLHEDDVVELNGLPAGFSSGYVAWVIGAKQATKRFPAGKIIQCISHLDYPVLLLGGKEDVVAGAAIANSFLGSGKLVVNACGAYRLNQSASLVQQARVVVSNDTGLMHAAAAFRRPVVSLWGNTIPDFGMYPYFGANDIRSAFFEVKGLDCRPCSKLGYDACPKRHFSCMNNLDELQIAATVNHWMSAGA